MKTFTDLVNELRCNRSLTTIQVLRAAGEKAIILDENEVVTDYKAKEPEVLGKNEVIVSWEQVGELLEKHFDVAVFTPSMTNFMNELFGKEDVAEKPRLIFNTLVDKDIAKTYMDDEYREPTAGCPDEPEDKNLIGENDHE